MPLKLPSSTIFLKTAKDGFFVKRGSVRGWDLHSEIRGEITRKIPFFSIFLKNHY